MAKVLIIGGGICGLGTALFLARDGHEVTLIERDADPAPEAPPDGWETWSRKGVTQFRQPHNFMPGLRLILEAELPDVQDALCRAGASRFDMINPPLFFACSMIGCRFRPPPNVNVVCAGEGPRSPLD